MKTVNLTIRVDPDLKQLVEFHAMQNDVTLSQLVRAYFRKLAQEFEWRNSAFMAKLRAGELGPDPSIHLRPLPICEGKAESVARSIKPIVQAAAVKVPAFAPVRSGGDSDSVMTRAQRREFERAARKDAKRGRL